jgi:hypothetical protein
MVSSMRAVLAATGVPPGRLRLVPWVGVLAVAMGAFGCADVARTPSALAPPRVTVTPDSVDLGVVGLGEEAVAEFVVRNEGGAPLGIDEPVLRRATRVDGLVPALRAGESVRLRFTIDTLNANADPRQDWTLVTSDPDRPRLLVPVRIDVRPFVVARPGQARYITVQHAREGTIAQTLGAVDGVPFSVLRVDSPLPSLRVSFREARPDERQPAWPGRQWRVESTLASSAPVGALSGAVVVHTDHPRQKRVVVPVSGFVRPILAATPPEARVGDLDRKRPRPLHVLIKNFAEEPIEVTEVTTDVRAVDARIEPVDPGRTWRLKLYPVSDAPLGPFAGKVRLRTANPGIPVFEVPLSGQLVDSARPN